MPEPVGDELRERLPVVDADTYQHIVRVLPPTIPDDLPFDPYYCARWLMRHDFTQYSPTGQLPWLVIDTISELCYDLLRYTAITGKGGASGAPLYGGDDEWDPDAYKAHRFQDYQDALGQTLALIKSLMRSQRFENVILLGHEKTIIEKEMVRVGKQYVQQENVVGYDLKLAGRAMDNALTIYFEQYMWAENAGFDQLDISAHLTSGDGKHNAKFRAKKAFPSDIHIPFDYEGQVNVLRELAGYAGYDLRQAGGPGFRTCYYGKGGTGKTMLWTSVPPEVLERGPMVYVSYDPAAHSMTSTHEEVLTRKNVHQ